MILVTSTDKHEQSKYIQNFWTEMKKNTFWQAIIIKISSLALGPGPFFCRRADPSSQGLDFSSSSISSSQQLCSKALNWIFFIIR